VKIVGSVIARLGSKRLPYKNLLPYDGVPLVRRAVEFLSSCALVDEVVVSTESELIARCCVGTGAHVLRRPKDLAGDEVASVPVFQHILEHFSCDLHVNYNCNFPVCDPEVVVRAIELAKQTEESLSVPFAVWAQTRDRLENYGDPFEISATRFTDDRICPIDVHHEADLLSSHRLHQDGFDLAWE
jgi:CMP-N-acetylneuraminic acid synthetase